MPHLSRRSAIMASFAIPATLALSGGVATRARAAAAAASVVDDSANALMVMSTDQRLTDWMRLVRAAHLEGSCGAAHPYTVFPLTDASFAAVPELMPALMPWEGPSSSAKSAAFADTSRITAFMRRHVVEGRVDPSRFAGRSLRLTSLDGQPIDVDGTGGVTRVTWVSAVDGRSRTATLDGQPIQTLNAMIYVLSNVANA